MKCRGWPKLLEADVGGVKHEEMERLDAMFDCHQEKNNRRNPRLPPSLSEIVTLMEYYPRLKATHSKLQRG